MIERWAYSRMTSSRCECELLSPHISYLKTLRRRWTLPNCAFRALVLPEIMGLAKMREISERLDNAAIGHLLLLDPLFI